MRTENFTAKKGALVTELDGIRAQIRTMGRPGRPVGGQKDLRELMEKHNRLVEDIYLLEQEPQYDPIERLPEEVSIAVLKEAAVRDSHGYLFVSTEVVLIMALVSLKWRRFIESMPSLWSDIVLDDQRRDLAMKVAISLFFSRNAYLTVQFVGPLHCWDEIASILLPHAGRIRSIYPVGDGANNSILLLNIKQLLTPQLRSIDWSKSLHNVEQVNGLFLNSQSDHLHRVSGITLTREVLKLPSIRNLKEFVTQEDAKRVLANTLPHLRKVTFLEKVYTDKESITLTRETLRWTSLTYRQDVMETLTLLLSRLPLLRELNLRIAHDDLSQFISSMRDLKALQSLELRLWKNMSKIFVPPVTIEPLDQMRTFIFMEESGIWSEAEWEKVSQIPNALFSLFPNVEVLEIKSSPNSMVHTLTSAAGFCKVHTLLLHLLGTSPLRDFQISESVRNLRIKFNRAIGFIAPGVERLRVVRLDLHNASNRYNAIQNLHFTHFEGPSNNFQPFTTLADIFVGGDEAVTRFCLIIATDPDVCPVLHTLSFGRFPDLDILFIMLERRNLYSHPARARIKKLELPTRMSLSNFKSVRDLLRGRIVERQSNFEASLQSNLDMFLDPDM
jgi:hypothetical protein